MSLQQRLFVLTRVSGKIKLVSSSLLPPLDPVSLLFNIPALLSLLFLKDILLEIKGGSAQEEATPQYCFKEKSEGMKK